jgi:drug/metabolite transporter (DMT)-like permease
MFSQKVATAIMLTTPCFFIPTTIKIVQNPTSVELWTFILSSFTLAYYCFYYLFKKDIPSILNVLAWLVQYIIIIISIINFYV